MPEESDRKIILDLLQTGLTISLGAAQKSLEMMRNPPDAISKIASEMKSMFTLPPNAGASAGASVQEQAQAIASVWMTRGATLVAECKIAGEKLSEGK